MTKEEYSLAVVKAKNNIGVGDHVVLSRRFYRRIDTDPFTVYRQLWAEPFRTYLKGRGYALISKSQENLVFVKQDTRELSERLSCWDALQAALPSAVVCGAPKSLRPSGLKKGTTSIKRNASKFEIVDATRKCNICKGVCHNSRTFKGKSEANTMNSDHIVTLEDIGSSVDVLGGNSFPTSLDYFLLD
ncbi:hypothetical protein C3L33_00600, partial [Rhododendron williamsianum]